MKKTNKALASLAIAGMALSAVPYNAFAATTVPTRLAGTTAEQTAVAIADQTGWTGAAVLASSTSYGMVDALTAGPLASFLKAPILLQGAGNTLNADTKAELQKLQVKTVYVTSGTAVISQSVLDQLSGMGISVVSLGGNDRFETSANIAKEMIKLGASVSKVAVAYGWSNQDALSIASIASAANEPILLTEKDSVPSSVQSFLASNSNITSSDVIGGTGVISDAVKADFPNATRHFGTTAYDTNNQVIQDFSSSLKFDNVYVANGNTGIDALAGAPLAAQTNSAIVLTDGTVPAAATFVHSKLGSNGVVTALGGTAVVSDAVRTGIESGTTTPAQGDLAVTSVNAVSADAIQVKFNQAPADTSKVAFTVTNSGVPVTVSATWNSDNTVATLNNSANFAEGTYSVDVKTDSTDLGSSNVTISQQKIAKINITSSKLAITQDGIGYASFTVLDQYGNDITSSYLANNITFQTGAGTITVPTTGVLKVTPNASTNLITFPTVGITGYDSTSGVSASATLATSTALGTLSSITLNNLTNANNAALTAADTSDTWYINYSAKDMSGNDTTDYSLVSGGLILSGANNDQLSSSSPYVTAKVVRDPSDSNKAAIQVTVSSDNIQNDLPVTITAMSYQGAPSTLNLTLKKQSAVDSFNLMAPSYNIASGELKEIPFTAYDQNGKQLTKYSDLAGNVTLSGFDGSGSDASEVGFQRNPDGTASLFVRATTVSGTSNQSVPQILTASTSTGKFSTITLNIQPAAKADTFSLDNTKVITAMQEGANERLDFGENYGGLAVKDQYGRTMDMTGLTGNAGNYEVVATTTGSALSLNGIESDKTTTTANAIASGGQGIEVVAGSNLADSVSRTQTVNFYLINKADESAVLGGDTSKAIDSQSVTFSVVKNSDISDYSIDSVANPIYAFDSNAGSAITAQQDDWSANPYVYGKTSGGAKVMMAPGFVQGAYVDDTKDFSVETNVTGSKSAATNAYDTVKVVGLKLDPTVSSAKANLTVTIKGADGLIHTVTTPISSSSVDPVAKTIAVHSDTTKGMHLSDDGNTIYIDNATAMTNELSNGALLQRNNTDETNTGRKDIYFYATDSYGSKGMNLANVYVVDSGTVNGSSATPLFTIANGKVDTNSLTNKGDYVVLSGVTTDGLVATVKIVKNY
ncbi:cell wall-binding protein [Desulfosporosinus acidiphilus SJ4]|uniref:Cell wall-binding protein n=1 Tax=Desulfosporosinus acidiphilus (strain DSM 22704 / JCM 16185 / SJ4) TaxID=646529 RepID=I4D2X7_DESAJ|nr:cell wall-binding repeat-containing protein [Desulfosporosinus acidiphilus]AFM40151.1 cell wall-binding protein [Desulfosporosinus acidiphilus SJ4]AFM40152.1 cell wall-binding protein [Desulfosporosinus acidiphilus SJ4]